MTKAKSEAATTRRTANARPAGRSARVVSSVLKATAEQLSRVGYAELRVEDVAVRSGVNKTTIYRRWPTKQDLVAAALLSAKGPATPTEVGDLRTDVLASIRDHLAFARTPLAKGIIRVVLAERGHPELAAITSKLRERQQVIRCAMISRAIERGDLPRTADPSLVADLLFMPIMTRAITFGQRLPDGYVEGLVDLVLAGARAGHEPFDRRAGGRARPKAKRSR